MNVFLARVGEALGEDLAGAGLEVRPAGAGLLLVESDVSCRGSSTR